MSKIETHRKRLKARLKDAGVYSTRLDEQISLTARQLALLDKMEEALDSNDVMDVVISAAGTEKKVLSPLILAIEKLYGQITDSYKSMGLNYNANAANVKESASSRDDDPLVEILKKKQNG